MIQAALAGLAAAATPANLFYCFAGSVVGTLVGVLPGLGPTAGIAILLPLAASMPPTGAIIMLAAIYYGSMYGGSTTAILVNMPGEAASVVTSWDGYKLAQQGRAGSALAVAAIGSFVAGTLGLVGLTFVAPTLAELALAFGPPEYFGLVVLSLVVVVGVFGKSTLRGLIGAFLGLCFTLPGLDPLFGTPRFTFGVAALYGGIDYISAVVGLFAIAEVLRSTEEGISSICRTVGRLIPTREELRSSFAAIMRGTGVGFALGLLPGVTPAIASFIAYDVERRVAPARVGTGALEGVAGPEAANNAITSAGFIPLFSLGIPSTPALAVLLGALTIYGLRPGPMLFTERPDFVWAVIASMYIGNAMLLVLNLPLVGMWARLTAVPYRFMAPAVLVFSLIGAYSIRTQMFDVGVALFFGLLGFALAKLDVPVAPLIMTLVLGPTLESSLGQSLALSRGSLAVFLHRPVALGLIVTAAVVLLVSARRLHLGRKVVEEAE